MRQYEFVAFEAAPGAGDPVFPAGATALHYAPARWLVVLPEGADVASLDAGLLGNAGVLVEVSGKYCALPFVGESGRRVLAATVNLEAVLPPPRNCAAVTLFDAPAVLARVADGFVAWVTASHVHDFTVAADRARRICEKMTG